MAVRQTAQRIFLFVMPAKAGIQGQATERMRPCVYILASDRNGTLYAGVTNDLARRMWEHRAGEVEGFTARYRVYRLVHVEFHATMPDAIQREKQIKTREADQEVASGVET
jgi:putative endonuclease